jgi:hypothetical protein
MKEVFKKIALTVVFLIVAKGYSQQTEYKNYLIEKERKDYNQAQIDKARNNTNSKSNTYTVDLDAAKKMVESWKASKIVNKTPEEKAIIAQREREKQIALEQYREKVEKDREENFKRYVAKEELIKPFKDNFINAGFSVGETHDITNFKMFEHEEFKPDQEKFNILIPALNYLADNIDVISFDDFETQIKSLFLYTPLTSLKLINEIKVRFPNKKTEVENMEFNCLIGFYNNFNSRYTKEEVEYVFGKFDNIIKNNPQSEMELFENIKYYGGAKNPYETLQEFIRSSDGKKEQKKYEELSDKARKVKGLIWYKYEEISKSSESLFNYLAINKFKSLEDIINLPENSNVKKNSKQYRGQYQTIYIYLPDLRASDQVLWELSEMGNFEAQVILAKKNCVNNNNIELKDKLYQMFLKRAVENDDIEAYKMLFNIPLWESLYVSEIVNKKLNDIPYSSEPNSPYKNTDYTERDYNLDLQEKRIDRAFTDVKNNICNIKAFNQLSYHIENFKIFGKGGRHKVIVPFKFTYPSAEEERNLSEYWVKNCRKK